MSSLTAVVVTHANEPGLRKMLGNLRYQTRQPDEINVVCTDTLGIARLREEFPDVCFDTIDEVGDWGHAKRAHGLELATSEYVGFFNDDDSYDARYCATMLGCAEREGGDVVYCSWNEQPDCDFAGFRSTAGNFIVRTELARSVGWHGRHYSADADFINALNAAGARVFRVHDCLYWHNHQP